MPQKIEAPLLSVTSPPLSTSPGFLPSNTITQQDKSSPGALPSKGTHPVSEELKNVNFPSFSDHRVKMGNEWNKNVSKSKGEYQFPKQPVQRFNEKGIQSPKDTIQMVSGGAARTVVKDDYKVQSKIWFCSPTPHQVTPG